MRENRCLYTRKSNTKIIPQMISYYFYLNSGLCYPAKSKSDCCRFYLARILGNICSLMVHFAAPRSTDGMLIDADFLLYLTYFRASFFLTSYCSNPTGFQHSLYNHSMKSWIYVSFSIRLRASSLVRCGAVSVVYPDAGYLYFPFIL